MENNGLSASDVALLTGNERNNGAFGGDGAWWIIILFLFVFCGWGNGFGGFGGGGTNGSGFQGYATRADINEGFALNGIENGIRGLQQGLCDSTYALNNAITSGFNTTQMGMMQGFNGVERGFCNLSSQLSDCCCTTQRAIDGVNYNMAKNACDLQNTMNSNTRDIIDNQNTNTKAILDFMTQDKIATLQAENQSLKLAASQANQNAVLSAAMDANTAEIIRRVNPTPVPSYVVPNPNCCYGNPVFTNACGNSMFGNNCGGCGC